MYSVILMMSLSNGAALPAWQDGVGLPVQTYGVHGTREYRHRRGGCCGCCGGCGGCYGCWGGCYGCWGGYSCCGCWGGSSWGYGGGGGRRSYYEGYEGGVYYGDGSYDDRGMRRDDRYMPGTPERGTREGAPVDRSPKGSDRGGDRGTTDRPPGEQVMNGSAAAILIVSLPADAKLSVDGQATRATSNTRRFVSPPLSRDADYFYTLKGELTRDAQTVSVSKRVRVRAGQESRVTLDFADTSVAQR